MPSYFALDFSGCWRGPPALRHILRRRAPIARTVFGDRIVDIGRLASKRARRGPGDGNVPAFAPDQKAAGWMARAKGPTKVFPTSRRKICSEIAEFDSSSYCRFTFSSRLHMVFNSPGPVGARRTDRDRGCVSSLENPCPRSKSLSPKVADIAHVRANFSWYAHLGLMDAAFPSASTASSKFPALR